MVDRTRELERALGSAEKFVSGNEQDTVVVQRRSLRAVRDLPAGQVLRPEDIEALRPSPRDAVQPYELEQLVGSTLSAPMKQGEHFTWEKAGRAANRTSAEAAAR